MGQPAEARKMTFEQYLAWEAEQQEKHEFFRGEVFAMTGALLEHVRATRNVVSWLHGRLRGGPCEPFASDAKLWVQADDAVYYPDVMVSCSPEDRRDGRFLREPAVVVEVLSPSTASYDRGAKFASYRKLASLRQVVFVDPELRSIDTFVRDEAGPWTLVDVAVGGELAFPALGVAMPWDDVFEGVEADEPAG